MPVTCESRCNSSTRCFPRFGKNPAKEKDLEQLTYKGEFVLIVSGADTVESDTCEVLDEPVSYEDAVQALVDTGVPKKEAIRQVAKRFNVSRRDVYNIVER